MPCNCIRINSFVSTRHKREREREREVSDPHTKNTKKKMKQYHADILLMRPLFCFRWLNFLAFDLAKIRWCLMKIARINRLTFVSFEQNMSIIRRFSLIFPFRFLFLSSSLLIRMNKWKKKKQRLNGEMVRICVLLSNGTHLRSLYQFRHQHRTTKIC